MIRKVLFAGLALVVMASSANAGVIFGLLLDPAATAGGGATSTRSGAGTWQLYAVDDSTSDFGISSYNITMTGATAINHRSTSTTAITDGNGDTQSAGFPLLRTATNANPIQASQPLPGTSPFLFTGFGQTAGTLAAKVAAVDAVASVGAATSAGWGNYASSAFTQPNAIDAAKGNKWFFIAEGLYTAGAAPTVSGSVATIFSTANFTSVAAQTSVISLSEGPIVPEPATLALLGMAVAGVFGFRRGR